MRGATVYSVFRAHEDQNIPNPPPLSDLRLILKIFYKKFKTPSPTIN